MNVLFLTMDRFVDISEKGIYTDLMREFRNEGHSIYVVSPCERREKLKTHIVENSGVNILRVWTLNVQKSSIIEKGLGQVLIEYQFKKSLIRYFKNIKFDLVLYSTPPITFTNVIKYLKKSNPQTRSYLLLKDIFPQNAVDLGLLSKSGLKSILYRYFRQKEKTLYELSDYIGCMSPANVQYVLNHNPEIDKSRVEVNPNSLALVDNTISEETKNGILRKYQLPTEKPLFIYGGNLGKPQGIPFLIECLEANKHREDCHFVIVGSGTYYDDLARWYENNQDACVTVMKGLPKEEYDKLAQACQIGLIFLDYRFTIPNFPSRLLSYLEYKMPVLCVTDPNCDMGSIASENGFGMWAPSNSVEAFSQCVSDILKKDIASMGENGYRYLKQNYLVEHSYSQIMKHFSYNV